jgi:BlaI family transcriptional regulator, penicillinase repressor
LQSILGKGEGRFACVKRISNANIFEAVISRNDAHAASWASCSRYSGGRAKLVMAHLVQAGELTLEDTQEAEKGLQKPRRNDKSQ